MYGCVSYVEKNLKEIMRKYAYIATDKDGAEHLFSDKPQLNENGQWLSNKPSIELPSGSIDKLISGEWSVEEPFNLFRAPWESKYDDWYLCKDREVYWISKELPIRNEKVAMYEWDFKSGNYDTVVTWRAKEWLEYLGADELKSADEPIQLI